MTQEIQLRETSQLRKNDDTKTDGKCSCEKFELNENEKQALRVACLDCLDFGSCWSISRPLCEDWYERALDGDLDAYPNLNYTEDDQKDVTIDD